MQAQLGQSPHAPTNHSQEPWSRALHPASQRAFLKQRSVFVQNPSTGKLTPPCKQRSTVYRCGIRLHVNHLQVREERFLLPPPAALEIEKRRLRGWLAWRPPTRA